MVHCIICLHNITLVGNDALRCMSLGIDVHSIEEVFMNKFDSLLVLLPQWVCLWFPSVTQRQARTQWWTRWSEVINFLLSNNPMFSRWQAKGRFRATSEIVEQVWWNRIHIEIVLTRVMLESDKVWLHMYIHLYTKCQHMHSVTLLIQTNYNVYLHRWVVMPCSTVLLIKH
jgi:hypothetical protein